MRLGELVSSLAVTENKEVQVMGWVMRLVFNCCIGRVYSSGSQFEAHPFSPQSQMGDAWHYLETPVVLMPQGAVVLVSGGSKPECC